MSGEAADQSEPGRSGEGAGRPLPVALSRLRHAEVAYVLQGSGLDFCLIKGATLPAWLATSQISADVDVLVPPHHIAAAIATLQAAGFVHLYGGLAPGEAAAHSSTLWRPGFGELDVHMTFPGLDKSPVSVWTALQPHIVHASMANRSVPVLDEVAACLLVVLAAARDGAGSTASLRLSLLLERSEAPWPGIVRLARETSSAPIVRETLRLLGGLELAESLDLPGSLPLEWKLRLEGAPTEMIQLASMQQLSTRDWVRRAARELFPTQAFMRVWAPSATTPTRLVLARIRRTWRLAVTVARFVSRRHRRGLS